MKRFGLGLAWVVAALGCGAAAGSFVGSGAFGLVVSFTVINLWILGDTAAIHREMRRDREELYRIMRRARRT